MLKHLIFAVSEWKFIPKHYFEEDTCGKFVSEVSSKSFRDRFTIYIFKPLWIGSIYLLIAPQFRNLLFWKQNFGLKIPWVTTQTQIVAIKTIKSLKRWFVFNTRKNNFLFNFSERSDNWWTKGTWMTNEIRAKIENHYCIIFCISNPIKYQLIELTNTYQTI